MWRHCDLEMTVATTKAQNPAGLRRGTMLPNKFQYSSMRLVHRSTGEDGPFFMLVELLVEFLFVQSPVP
jgi:hypothetical protein